MRRALTTPTNPFYLRQLCAALSGSARNCRSSLTALAFSRCSAAAPSDSRSGCD